MKNIWKKLSAGLLAFALVFTAIPPVTASADTTADSGTATSKKEQVIDVSESNSFTIPSADDVTYVLTGTNTAAEVYINSDCDIILRGVTLKRIHTDSEKALTVNITLEGDNVIHQDKNASQGALEVFQSNVTINGGEDDSLLAKSRAFPAYSSDGTKGGITINGGNITFELTDLHGGAPIQTTYTQNGGTVKVIGTTNYCFQYKVYMNGGSLEAEHHSPYEERLAFNNYVYMKSGASIKVSSSERPIGGAGRFRLGGGSAANDCLFIRFDDSSDFLYLDTEDEENDVLNDKNYAEIKVMAHDHDFEGSGCACGFVCKHDTDNGNCGVCGTYIYNINHQPTESEPYVTLNDSTGASYQWYKMKNISEITDKNKTYPLSTFDPEYFTESSTFDAATGWIPAVYSEEGYEYKNLVYVAAPYKEGDKVTIYFSSPVDYAELFGSGDNYVICEFDGNKATAVIPADGVYAVYAWTEDTEPTARVYVGDAEISALAGQTGATLSQYTYGDYYFCEATAKDGTVLTSALADFTYKITHQPTDREQYVSLNSSKGASYQWYVERDGIVQVTDEDNLGFTVLGAPPEIGGTYDSEHGWSPDEDGYYFTVWLDEGDIMNLEFSQTPEECFYLFSATEGTVEYDVTMEGTSLTAPASGYYGIGAADGGYLKATFDGTGFFAVSGQTEAALHAGELGRYRCEVTFANGKKKTSDIVEVLHLHAGGTATCKEQAVCSNCGAGYGPLSKDHKYDNACDTECNVCTTTRNITHDYKDATCTEAKVCKVCGTTEGTAKGHTPGAAATSTTPQICTVCLIELAPATGENSAPGTGSGDATDPGAGTTPGTGSGDATDPGTTPNPGTGTTPDAGGAGGSDSGSQTPIPDKGGNTTPNTGGESLAPAPTPAPQPTPDTGGSGGSTTDPGTTPESEHQCTFETTKIKATASKNGKIETKCTVCGTVSDSKIIYKAVPKLKTASFVYNGKQKSPAVVVKNSKGKTIAKSNYTITKPKGRKAIGKYTYTIKFKGDYTGTKKLTLTIKPAKPTIQAPKAAKKAITVKWKKGKKAQVTGYQVMVATNSKFTKNKKTATVKGYAKVSKKVTGLKAKTKYYVKVRTYKTVKGVKIYSDWSKVRQIKTK